MSDMLTTDISVQEKTFLNLAKAMKLKAITNYIGNVLAVNRTQNAERNLSARKHKRKHLRRKLMALSNVSLQALFEDNDWLPENLIWSPHLGR